MTEINNKPTLSSEKKLYKEPRLWVYGDIQTLTPTVASGNNNADGGGGSHKTS